MTKSKSFVDISLNYKLWLSSEGKNILGDGKIELLKSIDSEGSLSSAAKKLKISYRKAWDDLKKAEENLGFSLTERKRGGALGGKTSITKNGQKLILAYDNLQKNIKTVIDKEYEVFKNNLNIS